jgi:RNA polymerase sigma-70 factor (ECF subfamily)
VDEGIEQQFTAIRVNGQPALAILVDGELDTVITVTWVDGLVASIQMARNRDKLAAVVLPA